MARDKCRRGSLRAELEDATSTLDGGNYDCAFLALDEINY